MAKPDALVSGNCYFLLQFHDQDLLFPDVMTLMYVGSEQDDQGRRVWMFEDPPSVEDSDDEADEESPPFYAFGDDQLHQILDFPGLLRALSEVAPEHPIHLPTSAPPSPSGADAFSELRSQLAQWLDNPELVGLTITILFTDDGLSFSRSGEGLEVSFFLSARLEAEHEAHIRAVFAAMGRAPRADHLTNRDRTRTLSFPVSEDVGEMEALCRRILKDVYAMRETDALKFTPLTRQDLDHRS